MNYTCKRYNHEEGGAEEGFCSQELQEQGIDIDFNFPEMNIPNKHDADI